MINGFVILKKFKIFHRFDKTNKHRIEFVCIFALYN